MVTKSHPATSPIGAESTTHGTGTAARAAPENMDACARARSGESVASVVSTGVLSSGTAAMRHGETRTFFGATTRETLQAQLIEEVLAFSAPQPVVKYSATDKAVDLRESPKMVFATIASMTADITNNHSVTHQMALSDVSNMTPSFVQHNYGLPLVNYEVADLPLRRSRSSRLTTSELKSWMATAGIPRDGLSDATRGTGGTSNMTPSFVQQHNYDLPLVNYEVAALAGLPLRRSRSSRLKTSELKV